MRRLAFATPAVAALALASWTSCRQAEALSAPTALAAESDPSAAFTDWCSRCLEGKLTPSETTTVHALLRLGQVNVLDAENASGRLCKASGETQKLCGDAWQAIVARKDLKLQSPLPMEPRLVSWDLAPLASLAAAGPHELAVYPPDAGGANEFQHLDALAALAPTLVRLDLSDSFLDDAGFLAPLTALKELVLSNAHLRDIGPVASLTRLQELALGVNEIASLAPLAGLTKLKVVTAYRNPIVDLTPLASLSDAERIVLSDTQVTDLSPLSGLQKLWFLDLARVPARDFAPVAKITSLTSLDVTGNDLASADFLATLAANQEAAGVKGLTNLRAGENRLSDPAPLFKLKAVTSLVVPDNRFAALVVPPKTWPDIRTLEVAGNGLTHTASFGGLKSVERLNLSRNALGRAAIEELKAGAAKPTHVFLKEQSPNLPDEDRVCPYADQGVCFWE